MHTYWALSHVQATKTSEGGDSCESAQEFSKNQLLLAYKSNNYYHHAHKRTLTSNYPNWQLDFPLALNCASDISLKRLLPLPLVLAGSLACCTQCCLCARQFDCNTSTCCALARPQFALIRVCLKTLPFNSIVFFFSPASRSRQGRPWLVHVRRRNSPSLGLDEKSIKKARESSCFTERASAFPPLALRAKNPHFSSDSVQVEWFQKINEAGRMTHWLFACACR